MRNAPANPQRLDLLRQLREAVGLSQAAAARACGLQGSQSRLTIGAWERGAYAPEERRRTQLIHYLWDDLRLRQEHQRFAVVWEMLVEEWDWEPLSDNEWGGLTQQTRPATSPVTSPPSRVTPFQAPALTPHFVGRAAEFIQLKSFLIDPTGPRVIAVVGMGGIGKTTLATALAHQLRTQFPDGVLWANPTLSNPLDVLQSWAHAYGHDLSTLGDVATRAAAIRDLLANKQTLIILDDVTTVTSIRPLLPGLPTSLVLMTMRDRDIATALNVYIVDLHELVAEDSGRLLTQILGERRVQAEAENVYAICSTLQNLPLAVEITAKLIARAPGFSLAAMAARLLDAKSRLDQLQFKDLSVRASFEVSWQMLSEPLRRSFALSGIFAGRSFTTAALAAIAQLDESSVEEQLVTLVALSLLWPPENARYGQHQLLADFAQERLADVGAAQQRLAEFYLRLCRQIQLKPEVLEPDFVSILTTLQAMYDQQQWSTVIDLAESLATPWLARARYTEARHGYAWATSAAQMIEDSVAQAEFLIRWGFACCEQGDFGEAQTRLTSGLQLAQTEKQPVLIADAQFHLGRIAVERGDYETADELLTSCQVTREQMDDRPGEASVIHLRATLIFRQGDGAQAELLCQKALALQEALLDLPGQLDSLRLLIDIAIAVHNDTLAKVYGDRALRLLRTVNYPAGEAEISFSYATVCRRLGEFDKAWDYAEAARQLFTRMNNRAMLTYVLYEQSMIKKQIGDYATSLEIGLTSLARMVELGEDYNRMYCLYHLGDLYWRMARRTEAKANWSAGEELAHTLHHPLINKFRERLETL